MDPMDGYIQDSAQSGAFGVADAALGGEKANQAKFGLER